MSFQKKIAIFIVLLAVITQAQVIPTISINSVPVSSSFLYPSTSSNCCSDLTIDVHGQATVQANPDTASLSAQVTVNADTVDLAIAALSSKVINVISILTSNGLNSSNYQTSSLSVYPNTSYANGVSAVIGQIATQGFSITIPNINPNGSNIGKLIDDLSSVNGIILNGLSFSLNNQTDQLAIARGNAFANAQQKALDYTTSLQLSLGQLVQVVDDYSIAPVIQPLNKPLLSASNIVAFTPTTINVGTIPISYYLELIYSFA